jgi:hypothetical protein
MSCFANDDEHCIVTCLGTETPFGLLIGFMNNFQFVTTITYSTVTQLTIITRQSAAVSRIHNMGAIQVSLDKALPILSGL